MARPPQTPETLAQARNIRQVVDYLIYAQEQRDRQVAEQLERLDRKIDQLTALVRALGAEAEAERLETFGFVVQANEVLRRLRDEVRATPGETAAAIAAGALRLDRPPVEVGPRHSTSASDELAA